MKKETTGQIDFDITLNCPHCEEFLNLFDGVAFPCLNDEGEITKIFTKWFGNEPGGDEPNLDVECPKCGKEINVNKMEY